MLLLIPFADVGLNFGFRELADAAAQQLLLFRQPEVHERFRISRGGASG